MTNDIQGSSHHCRLVSQQELYKPEGNRKVYLKWGKRRTYNQEYSTQQDSPSDLMEKSKAFQTSQVKRIQHHQTSFTTNAQGTSLGRKHKRRRRPTENKPKTVKKTVIGSLKWSEVKWIRSVVSDSLRTHGHQAPLSMGFSRQEYWSGLPFPSPGNLPDPGTEPRSPAL